MKVPFFQLVAQYDSVREEIEEAAGRVFRSGWYILGPEVEAFEREFADWCGVEYAAGVGNSTEAIQLALCACGITPGDEVVTVPNVSAPTVATIHSAGFVPLLVDVDENTLNLSPARLQEFLARNSTGRVRAVIPVHLYGQPADMEPILDLARLAAALCQRGTATAVHYPTPIHFQSAYRELGYVAGEFPASERACREILFLPLYPELAAGAVSMMAREIVGILRAG